ncbi:MAG: hypothetical protein ACK5HP_00880 [Bacilli bacterium]
MRKIDNELINIVSNLKGEILGIGINSENVKKALDINNNIITCNLLENKYSKKGKGNQKTNTIRVSKFRKQFKKKKIDCIIVNKNEINNFTDKFIKDSIYLAKNDIYLFCIKDNMDKIQQKYKIYTKKIDLIECLDGYILKINLVNIKSTYFKDKLYDTINFISELSNIISEILIK